MSKSSESNNAKCQSIKYCENVKIEEGRIGGVKVQKTLNTNGNDNIKKMKWPALCDANPYIVDLWKNLFKKEEKSETATSATASPTN